MTTSRHRVSFLGDENVLRYTATMAAQFCKYTKNQLIT